MTFNMIRRVIIVCALCAFALAACETEAEGAGAKLTPTVTWPQTLVAVNGEKLSDVSLTAYTNTGTPGVFNWTTPDHYIYGTVGAVSLHNMTFTPDDTATYHAVANNVAVRVSLVDMVLIHSGIFTMGSPAEDGYGITETQFSRVLVRDDFYLGKFEVTQRQWEEVLDSLPLFVTEAKGKGDDYPVYGLTIYTDILKFCNKLSEMEGFTPAYCNEDGDTDPVWWAPTDAITIVEGSNGYRLPTEVQWEYACRAGTETPWHSAATEDDWYNPLDDYAVYNDWWHHQEGTLTTVTSAASVGTKKPNKWGLYDMHGNVSEYCWDLFGNYPAFTDPYNVWRTGGRVLRGGNWNNRANLLRSAYRSANNPDGNSGFRIARPVR